MTYYKYAERSVENEINWNQIGKNLSDSLMEEQKLREDKKEAIDQATNEYAKTLNDAPIGDSGDINKFTTDYVQQVQEARLLQDRLLKSGKLSLKDYTLMRQNLKDGTDTMYGMINGWNQTYKNGMQRWQTGKSSSLELQLLSMVESFGKLGEHGAYINPTDYSLSIGKKVKDPKTGQMVMDSNPNGFSSVASLKNVMSQQIDKYDPYKTLEAGVKLLGERINQYRKDGYDISVTEMNSKDFKDNYFKSIKADPMTSARILADTIGQVGNETFSITRDPNDKAINKILFVDSGRGLAPKLRPEQEKLVDEWLSENWDAMVSSSIAKRPVEIKTEKVEKPEKRVYTPEETMSIDSKFSALTDVTKDGVSWLKSKGAPIKKVELDDGTVEETIDESRISTEMKEAYVRAYEQYRGGRGITPPGEKPKVVTVSKSGVTKPATSGVKSGMFGGSAVDPGGNVR